MNGSYFFDVFLSMSGLQQDRFMLEKTGRIRHSVVLTEEKTGVLRAVHLDIQKDRRLSNRLTISGHYILHAGQYSNYNDVFLKIDLDVKDGLVSINKAKFLGYDVDVSNSAQTFALISGLNKRGYSKSSQH